ncbi:hypothetical protein AMS68_007382 [Peltaster fructicola]|uniref:FAD-binding FR-type domain-containing protein n=1 Tax=Peltaster fructicola TaxID=286661 RepID=A0A6H0Y4L2_9PEZI|nr:hypothetical protein AMS68_007382 [Peltaster fructicola]
MDKLQPYDSNPEHKELTNDELEAFFADIDTDNDGFITIDELEAKLEKVHDEIAPAPEKHHLHHPHRRSTLQGDVEAGTDDDLKHFLQRLLPGTQQRIDRDQFISHVRAWHIPSQDQTSDDHGDEKQEKALPIGRRLRARWSVDGPKIVFILCVSALTIGLSVWQGVKYINSPDIRAALGWGVIMAKFFAGALYSITFFLILSMSRVFATFMRRFYYISRFINWDRSQSFHIWMACIMVVFATLHGIGHLTGTFLTGSQADRRPALRALYSDPEISYSYADYVARVPGWTGIVSLGLVWVLSLLSMPAVRRWSYELFQLGHLLMFPIFGLLAAHGTAQILGQYPMLGFWLIVLVVLVIMERCQRIIRGFIRVDAKLTVLDDETVTLICFKSGGKPWRYAAGQYVFLQVPSLSLFQWHPFTISACREDKLQLHIKTDGNWTKKLRNLEGSIQVGIDGPFGAPAQRFYDFDKSIIVGSGIGVTPFSAIVTDLEQDLSREQDPWTKRRRGSSVGPRRLSSSVARQTSDIETPARGRDNSAVSEKTLASNTRRVDFHWTVRDKAHLLWFSSLLNRAHDLSESAALKDTSQAPLDLNIHVHVTAKRKNISTHVFRYLLDSHRTKAAPYSALTGLKARSNFGRPDFVRIMDKYHDELVRDGVSDEKVGVFYCGTPVVGAILSDQCHELTAKSRQDGTKIRYIFMIEVFG